MQSSLLKNREVLVKKKLHGTTTTLLTSSGLIPHLVAVIDSCALGAFMLLLGVPTYATKQTYDHTHVLFWHIAVKTKVLENNFYHRKPVTLIQQLTINSPPATGK